MAIKFLSGLDLEVTSSVLKTDANGVIIAAVAGTDYAAASHTHSYLPLAGGTLTGNVRLNDSVQLQIGSSNDAYITHNGTNTYFVNGVGNLEITNDTTDGDIIFKSDNGSGGLTTYFFLDGGSVATQFNQRALFIDNIAAEFGSSRDLKIYHDGSNSYVENDTGDLYIRSNFQDRDIILQSDNGGGGIATYIQIDGSTGAVDLNHYGTKKLETTSTGVTVTGNARVTGAYYDSSNTPGTVNQLLSSTVTGTTWIDPSTITAEAATLVVIACKNTSGATIAKGTPVYQTGTVGATATIEIATADALISSGKLPAIGLLQTTLNNNGLGFVVISGALTNFTTSPIDGVVPTTGDKVFVKSGGGLTLTKPTGEGNGIQNMGLVGKVSSGSAGTITVSSIMRTNDVPNLPEGRIWVGDGNTLVSDTVYVDEPNLRLGIGTTTPGTTLDVSGVITATGGTSTQWNTAYTYSQVGHLPLAGGTLTGDIDMAAGKGITFYGNGSADHGIFGKDSAGNSSDDIRINSYHSVHVNLDSNSNNNSSSTFFTIGEHGGTGTIGANVFSVDGSGNTVIAGDVVVSGGDITLEGTGRIQGVDTVSAATDAANKGYVDDSITDLIGGAPGTLDTLNELAAAINDDASYATTLTSALATKLPLAGGTLTGDVTFTGATHHAMWDKSASALEFWDNAKLTFGDPGGTPDLQIYHDGSHSYIQDVGTGNLNITSSGGSVQINKGLSENMAEFIVDGAVNLYYDSAKKFETTSTGVAVTGNLDSPQISVNDYISHNGDSNTYFGFPTADNIDFVAGGNLNFVVNANQTYLRYQGSTKLTTSSTGVTVTGLMQASTIGVTNIVTNKVVKFNGSILDDSNITDTGSLITLGSNTTVTGNLTLSGGSSIIDQGTIYIQDVAGGRIGFNRNTSNGNIHNSGYNAFQLQSNTNDVDGKFEIQAYQGSDGVSGGSFYINKAAQPLINDYILHYGDENTKIGFSSSDTFIVHTGGTTALTVDSSQNATFAGDVNLAAGKKIKYSANSFMTPENNVSGAEISTAGTFIVKTGTTPTLGLTLDASQNATFTSSVFIPDYIRHVSDPSDDTYFGFSANDTFVVYTAGGKGIEIDSNRNATFTGQIKSTRAPGANHGDPTIALGDGNTGFYERSDNDLRVSIGGSGLWEFSSNCMGSVSEGKAHFNNETATATNPSIIPWRNDADTGIGRGSANVLSLIAGGTEALSLSTTTATFAGDVTVNGTLTANTTSTSDLGTAYTVDSTTGTTAIIDTFALTATDHSAVYQIIATFNPNSGGSSVYRDVIFGKILVTTGYESSVKRFIHYVEESPIPRDLNGSGGGNRTMEVVFLVGTTESENVASNATPTIRVKLLGFDAGGSTPGSSGIIRIKRIM